VPVQDSLDLALALEKAFGKGVSLVGKAVALPLMFSAEFVMALHEGASAYVPLTKMMHRLLREKGLAFPLYPILRLRCCTWDALSTSDVRFQLPSHLASAFQKDRLSAQEFAATWQEVVDRQGALLDHLRSLKTPEELLAYLSTRDPAWKEQAEDWSNAHRALHEIGEWVKCYKMEVDSLSAAITSLNAEVADLDRRKGSLRRLESLDGPLAAATQLPWPSSSALLGQQPLPPAEDAEAQRQELDAQIRARHAAVRHRKAVLKRALAALREVENGDLAVKARKMIARVEASAELARARLARDALLVQGLARGNLRPTAWWFPLLDADCRWFKQVARTAQLSFEEFDAP
jgi:prefoldin subunit 5